MFRGSQNNIKVTKSSECLVVGLRKDIVGSKCGLMNFTLAVIMKYEFSIAVSYLSMLTMYHCGVSLCLGNGESSYTPIQSI